jgi:hypothetical protein
MIEDEDWHDIIVKQFWLADYNPPRDVKAYVAYRDTILHIRYAMGELREAGVPDEVVKKLRPNGFTEEEMDDWYYQC